MAANAANLDRYFPTKGNYDFSAIEKHLSELAVHHKQLILLLETKNFGYPDEVSIMPGYVLNDPQFEDAVFKFPAGPGAVNGQSRTGRRGSI